MKRPPRLALAVALLLVATPAAAGLDWFSRTWPEALARSRASRRPLLLDFCKPACGPCAMLDSAFASRAVIECSAAFVCVRRDVEEPEGAELAHRFKAVGTPILVFIDPKGDEIDRIVGSMDASSLAGEMRRIRRGRGTVPDLLSQSAQRDRDPAFNFTLGSKLRDRSDPRARAFLSRVLELDPENASGRADDALMKLSSLACQEGRYASGADDLERLIERYPQSELIDQSFTPLAQCYHAVGDDERALATLERAVARSPDRMEAWNDLAWTCAEWRIGLDRALAAAQRAVELSHDDPLLLDTLAEVYFARGEYALAEKTERRAVDKGPENDVLRAQLSRFEAARKAAESPGHR